MVYNRHDVVIGRSLELYGEYSEGETDLFRQVVRPGHVVVEAGANIGAHTLPLSRLVGDRGRVHAFEPQRGLFQMLCANLALSGRTNVEGHCAALGATPGRILVPELDPARPANFGGLALGGHPRGVETPLTTVDTLGLARLDLLKVDVEGMELAVLEGAAETIGRCRPLLYVENDRVERSPALIEWILARGYRLYWHLPALYQPANYFGNPVNVFERIVSSNMLGVHAAVTASITGLRPIERPDEHWMRAKG
jgi:FkbM family methyltransferase